MLFDKILIYLNSISCINYIKVQLITEVKTMKYNMHFTGIGGAGTSVLARLARDLGFSVSGSDNRKTPITDSLQNEGITFHEGHSPENIPENTGLLVYSSAVGPDNPELVYAKENNIPNLISKNWENLILL